MASTEGKAPSGRPSRVPTFEVAARYRLRLAYDGRAYHGWQRHPGKPTVQGALEEVVEEVFGVRSAVHASGRTDRGVHADAQVVHFDAPFELPVPELQKEFEARLPSDLKLLALERTKLDFHARESATGKCYRYEIYNAPRCPAQLVGRVWHIPGALDRDAMRAACRVFEGTLDFASFAKKTNYERASTTRTISKVDMQEQGPLIVLRFEADGFLYKMVRNLVRALVKVGEGRSDATNLQAILAAKDRAAAPGTAPPTGLFLERVDYASWDGGVAEQPRIEHEGPS